MIAPTFSPQDVPKELLSDVLAAWFALAANHTDGLPYESAARLAICAGMQLVTPVATITPKIAAEVLWVYDHPGAVEPSGYRRALIWLIKTADQPNRQRLALAEPAYVAAVQIVERSPDGVATLTAIAKAGS